MKVFKKVLALALVVCVVFALSACGANKQESKQDDAQKEITVAYQYGIAYAPILVMKEKGLIEEAYKAATGKTVKVNWEALGSGAEINEAIEAGKVQIGAMGSSPAITGIEAGMPYKIFTSVSSQSLTLQTNDKSIKTLKDIVDKKEIVATVGTTSIQRLVLAMACEEELGNPTAIPDENIEQFKHPDGKVALETGTRKLHLTSPPFNWQEVDDGYAEVSPVTFDKVWPAGTSFIVGVASNELYNNDSVLYEAVRQAMNDSVDFINNNQDEAATMLSALEDVDKEVYLKWLQRDDCVFSTTCEGVEKMAQFMYKNKFLKNDYKFSDITFGNVKGN